MESTKLDVNLTATLAAAPEGAIPITVVFTRIVAPDELAGLGLAGTGVSGSGGTMANGALSADAIRALDARDDVHRISSRPQSHSRSGP